MGSPNEFQIRPFPKFSPPATCDCPQLVAQPTNPAEWPWHIRNAEEMRAFVADLGTDALERLLVFYLDDVLNLLAIEMFTDDDPVSVLVPIGRILCRARRLDAKGLILVHNHPKGDARPSRADIALTRRVHAAAEAMDITLVEHVICAGVELRAMNYM